MKRNAACFLILIRMLSGCGFRINELLNLKTMDIDFHIHLKRNHLISDFQAIS